MKMSEHKKMLYNITFQPDKSNNLSPDLVTFKCISHISITLDTGELCQVKQRGGHGARIRRNKNRQERKQTQPIGNEKEENENAKRDKDEKEEENNGKKEEVVNEEEDEKDIDNENKKLEKKLEELRNKNKILFENRKARQLHMDKNPGNLTNFYPMDKNVGTNNKFENS